jgi:lipoprotein
MKHTLILFTLIAIITGCSREDITETNQREFKTDITPAVVDSTDNGLDSDIGDWKPGSHGEVDMEEKEE